MTTSPEELAALAVVYFIQHGEEGPIKIGKATVNAETRRQQLQIGNPVQLNLRGQVSGGVELERRLHLQLADHRLGGEWFANVPEVREAIRAVLVEPGRTTKVVWRTMDTPRHSCRNCGAVDVNGAGALCGACREFAEAREMAAQGIDPFA